MIREKEHYALKILNQAVNNIGITKKEKVQLCNEFIKEMRRDREA